MWGLELAGKIYFGNDFTSYNLHLFSIYEKKSIRIYNVKQLTSGIISSFSLSESLPREFLSRLY